MTRQKWYKRKKPTELFGYALTCVAMGFIATILVEIDFSEWQFDNPSLTFFYILLFGVLASSSVFIGAYCWKLILEFINAGAVSTRDVFHVYLKSNIAKYLPGNVMHYAGRNYLGSKLGWKNVDMALSSLLEYFFGIGLTGLIILLLAALGFVNFPQQFTLELNVESASKIAVVAVLASFLAIVMTFMYRYLVIKEPFHITMQKMVCYASRFFTAQFLILFIKILLFTLLSFLINCVFYFYLCDVILDFQIRPTDIFNAGVALSIASYTSILTPGVPGGIGVKESVSVLIISAYGYPKESLLLSLLVFRITCVLGDVIPFLALKLCPSLKVRE